MPISTYNLASPRAWLRQPIELALALAVYSQEGHLQSVKESGLYEPKRGICLSSSNPTFPWWTETSMNELCVESGTSCPPSCKWIRLLLTCIQAISAKPGRRVEVKHTVKTFQRRLSFRYWVNHSLSSINFTSLNGLLLPIRARIAPVIGTWAVDIVPSVALRRQRSQPGEERFL